MRERGADFLVADFDDVLFAGIRAAQVRPHGEQLAFGGTELRIALGGLLIERGERLHARTCAFQHEPAGLQLLTLAREAALHLHAAVIAAHRIGQFRQIAHARRRHDGVMAGRAFSRWARQRAIVQRHTALSQPVRQPVGQRVIQRRHAIVVEVRGLRAEHRHVFGPGVPLLAVALHLLGDIAPCVLRALAVELVDRHQVGKVQHVDLFQLAGGAKLGRHHVQRQVDVRHDGRIALADAGGLHDDEVEARRAAGGNRVGQRLGNLAARLARGQRAHEDIRMVDRVHADAIAQQRATRLAPRWVNRDDSDAQPVLLIEPEAADQLIGQRRFTGTARARDAEHRRMRHSGALVHGLTQCRIDAARFQRCNQLRECTAIAVDDRLQRGRRISGEVDIAAPHHVGNHAGQAHALAVFWAVDARHAVVLQLTDLGGHDHPAAAAEHLDVLTAARAQRVDHVLEVFDVATLVARHGNALHVFLQRGVDHLVHRAVMPEVDHLAAHRLQDAPHDVDRRVVPVEQRGGRHEAHLVAHRGRFADGRGIGRAGSGKIGHVSTFVEWAPALDVLWAAQGAACRSEDRIDSIFGVDVNINSPCDSSLQTTCLFYIPSTFHQNKPVA